MFLGCLPGMKAALSAQLFAAFGAAAGKHITTGFCGHAGAETMTAFAHKLARLKSPFHVSSPQAAKRDRPAGAR